jgi:FtsH-binding integral membrane protein
VIGIVAAQLAVTFVIIIPASLTSPINPNWCFEGLNCQPSFGTFCASLGVQLTSVFVYLFSFIALMCSRGLRHKTPTNYIMLLIFTLSMAFMVAGITAYLTPGSVMLAIGILALILGCLWMSVMLTTDMARAARSVCLGILAAIMI